jgi:uncharacterized protein (TIGR00251 family)
MRLSIKVYPNSKKQEIVKIEEDKYKIYLKNKAEDNKANIELLKLLRKEFNKQFKITRGKTSKEKICQCQ